VQQQLAASATGSARPIPTLLQSLPGVMQQNQPSVALYQSINPVTSVAMKFIENSCQSFPKITYLVDIDLFHQPKKTHDPDCN
jgi:hypothetical protein